jgi:PilZ domain
MTVAPSSLTPATAGLSAARRFTLAALESDSKLFVKFSECFREFNVDVRPMKDRSAKIKGAQKITGCMVPLNDSGVEWLRSSDWFAPRRTLIYGIGDAEEATRFQDLGINALLESTTDFSVRLAVSATQSVVSHGVGECARVPLVTAVTIEEEEIKLQAITRNVGKGGMAASLPRMVSLPEEVNLSFALPEAGRFQLRACPLWYSGRVVGLKFHPSRKDNTLKKWIADYSSLGCNQ